MGVHSEVEKEKGVGKGANTATATAAATGTTKPAKQRRYERGGVEGRGGEGGGAETN